MSKNKIYDPIKNKCLEDNHCFLCGVKLTKSNRSEEHIFPKWLLKRFNLWNDKLALINRKTIPYRQVKIPCCKKCNSVHLGKLEKLIEKASKRGYKEFKKIPKQKIFLWLQKIYYQLLYMDLRLFFDPSVKSKGTIIDKETLERYRTCHIFLQATRMKVKFHKPYPWSVFLVKTQKYKEKRLNFDFKDNPLFLTIAIRMNDIGIVACLQDNNTQEATMNDFFKKLHKMSLHPVQFNELTAKAFYKASLLNRIPKYIIANQNNRLEVVSMPVGGMSSKPVYDDWQNAEYAKWLSEFCNIPYNNCYEPSSNCIWTILYDENGKFRPLDIKTCGF